MVRGEADRGSIIKNFVRNQVTEAVATKGRSLIDLIPGTLPESVDNELVICQNVNRLHLYTLSWLGCGR